MARDEIDPGEALDALNQFVGEAECINWSVLLTEIQSDIGNIEAVREQFTKCTGVVAHMMCRGLRERADRLREVLDYLRNQHLD